MQKLCLEDTSLSSEIHDVKIAPDFQLFFKSAKYLQFFFFENALFSTLKPHLFRVTAKQLQSIAKLMRSNHHAHNYVQAIVGAEKGEPVAMLLSPSSSSPIAAADSSRHTSGRLFTIFLTAPLQAFCLLLGHSGSDIDMVCNGQLSPHLMLYRFFHFFFSK